MKAGNHSKLAIIILLTLALVVCIAPMAPAADQEVSIAQNDTVVQIQAKIQAVITAVKGSGNVTVTGSKNGANAALNFNIPEGVTVIWQADYTGGAKNLIELEGPGAFEVADGSISASIGDGYAIYSTNSSVTVSGGMVDSANGDAIFTLSGDVTISGDAIVQTSADALTASDKSKYFYRAISTNSGNVTVSSGAISASGEAGRAIHTGSGEITVSGGMVSASGVGGWAIYTESGEITVSGGTVSASGESAYAIWTSGSDITVSSGKVSATGAGGRAIGAEKGAITVTGGTVSASGNGGCAINGGDVIEISGGMVSATGGVRTDGAPSYYESNAIFSHSGEINITGGTVENTGDGGIAVKGNSGHITVSGNAIVRATGNAYKTAGPDYCLPFAIRTVSGNVTVDGGTVSATGDQGQAIFSFGGIVTFIDNETPRITGAATLAPFIQGFENNTFRGDSMMTREQFVTILYRMKNLQKLPVADATSPSFNDVAPGRWSYDAIEWAKKAGIIVAGADSNFRPAAQLSRADMAVMLVRADNLTSQAANTFSDLADHPAKEDILKAVQAKIFTGYPNGTFKPDGFSTRAEAVTALIRYLLGGEPTDEMWQSQSLRFTDTPKGHWAYKYIALAVNGL